MTGTSPCQRWANCAAKAVASPLTLGETPYMPSRIPGGTFCTKRSVLRGGAKNQRPIPRAVDHSWMMAAPVRAPVTSTRPSGCGSSALRTSLVKVRCSACTGASTPSMPPSFLSSSTNTLAKPVPYSSAV